jgi:hypothetical protein
MSGFSEHVLGMLRDNTMLHRESIGWILSTNVDLKDRLLEKKMIFVSEIDPEGAAIFDYVVLDEPFVTKYNILKSFSLLSRLGIIILNISDWGTVKELRSEFGDFTATPLNYGNSKYLLIHKGVDYGN